MDFNDSADEAAYRARARAWLDANAPHRDPSKAIGRRGQVDEIAAAKAWQMKKANARYACITWPPEHGGGGGPPWSR